MSRPSTAADTSNRILDVAERLVKTRGFNAFSYADIAEALKVTKASLHYHFPTKADLGARLVERYSASFLSALVRIEQDTLDAIGRLNAYVGIYADVLEDNRICLCGMLAAEYATLPGAMRKGIRGFFDANEAWLAQVLATGRRRSQIGFIGSPSDAARALMATLEGAMLLARSRQEPAQFRSIARRSLSAFKIRRAAA
ncbi:MAG TPA: TetR/AcrR family transcriptional regulator [Rhodopila sp.]